MAAIGRFQKGDDIFYGKVVDGELFKLQGDVFGSPSFEKKATPFKGLKTLTPVAPSKIIAIGLNYADHARESGKPLPKEPLFWFKATTSLIPDGAKIEIPFPNHRTDFEAELAIVIGRRVRNVTPAAAARYIFGYTAAQDISDRTIQNAESQWARAKSFDTFTPLGPYIETKIDPHDLTIQLFQNGQLRQNSNTSQLIFNCFQIVSFVSTNMTLLPGDVIVTGTPSGVGPIQSGEMARSPHSRTHTVGEHGQVGEFRVANFKFQMENLKGRTKKFALDIIRFCAVLPQKSEIQIITRQLMRSATSVAANYRAACRGKSKADFICKLSTVEEEADESMFWLEMLAELDAGQKKDCDTIAKRSFSVGCCHG